MYKNILIRYFCVHDYFQYKILHTLPQLFISYGHLNKNQFRGVAVCRKFFITACKFAEYLSA